MTENVLPAYYAAAGELFGYLREACKFGDWDMRTTTFGLGESPKYFVYRIDFKVMEQRYCIEQRVPFYELSHAKRMQAVAERIIYKCTGYHDRLMEEMKHGIQTIQVPEGRNRAESEAAPAVS